VGGERASACEREGTFCSLVLQFCVAELFCRGREGECPVWGRGMSWEGEIYRGGSLATKIFARVERAKRGLQVGIPRGRGCVRWVAAGGSARTSFLSHGDAGRGGSLVRASELGRVGG
jgi:hypothetical protein